MLLFCSMSPTVVTAFTDVCHLQGTRSIPHPLPPGAADAFVSRMMAGTGPGRPGRRGVAERLFRGYGPLIGFAAIFTAMALFVRVESTLVAAPSIWPVSSPQISSALTTPPSWPAISRGPRSPAWKSFTADRLSTVSPPPRRIAGRSPGIGVVAAAASFLGQHYGAPVLLFALRLLGKEDVALYDGSWSEWGADPATPKEVGPAA